MSFDRESFGRVSVSANTEAPRQWNYDGVDRPAGLSPTGDNLATIKAGGYFNNVRIGHLQVGDLIYIVGTDGEQFVVVITIDPLVEVAANPLVGGFIIIASGIIITAASPAQQTFPVVGVQTGDTVLAHAQNGATGSVLLFSNVPMPGEIIFNWDINPGVIGIGFAVIRSIE